MSTLRAAGAPMPLDPQGALALAFEARRMQSAGRWWVILFAVGAALLVTGLLFALKPDALLEGVDGRTRLWIFVGAEVFFVGGGMWVRQILQRRASRAIEEGMPHAAWPAVPAAWTYAAIAAAVLLFVSSAWAIWFEVVPNDDRAAMLAWTGSFGFAALALAWHAWKLRFWEYAAAALAAGWVMFAIHGVSEANLAHSWMYMSPAGLGFLVASWCLRRRWLAACKPEKVNA